MGDEPTTEDEATFPEPEPEPDSWPGVDPDGKTRHPLFAGRYAAPDMSMAGAGVSDPRPPRRTPNGAIAPSPFPRGSR